MGTRKPFLHICLICCILLLFSDPVTGSDPVFQGEIIGHLDFAGLIGVPVPPNYNGTISPADIPCFTEVVFRLCYSGESPAELSRLDITQEITSYRKTWNYTHVTIDLSPSITLLTGESYTFLVIGSSNLNFIDDGFFCVKITTNNLGVFWISFSSQGLFHSLPSWPLSTSPSVPTGSLSLDSTSTSTPIISTNSSPGWFFLFPFFCAFILLLRTRDRNK